MSLEASARTTGLAVATWLWLVHCNQIATYRREPWPIPYQYIV